MKKVSDSLRRAIEKWRVNNPDRVREYKKRYREANKLKILAYNRTYRQSNPGKRETREQANGYGRTYYNKHRSRIIEKQRYRDSEIGKLSVGIIDKLLREQNYLCVYCKTRKLSHREDALGLGFGRIGISHQ